MGTVLASWSKSLFTHATKKGIDAQTLIARSGVEAARLSDPLGRIPTELDTALWRVATEELHDDEIGIDFAEASVRESSFGVVGLLARSCDTAEQALKAAVEFNRLIKDDGTATYTAGDDGSATVRWMPAPEQGRWFAQIEDAIAATPVLLGRRWTGARFDPVRVRMQRARPSSASRLESLFNCPVEYEQEATELVFGRDTLSLELRDRQSELARHLAVAANAYLDALGSRGLGDEVAEAIVAVGPDLASVARHVGMSPRTLQRHLQAQGSSFQEMVDRHRKKLAFALLSEGSFKAHEVATRCGFADSTSLRRALRRWAVADQKGA